MHPVLWKPDLNTWDNVEKYIELKGLFPGMFCENPGNKMWIWDTMRVARERNIPVPDSVRSPSTTVAPPPALAKIYAINVHESEHGYRMLTAPLQTPMMVMNLDDTSGS